MTFENLTHVWSKATVFLLYQKDNKNLEKESDTEEERKNNKAATHSNEAKMCQIDVSLLRQRKEQV